MKGRHLTASLIFCHLLLTIAVMPCFSVDKPHDGFLKNVNMHQTDYTSLGKTMRYVRPGASGSDTGLNWNDAYSSMPSSLVRDYVYFLADGEYGSYKFDDAVSGTDRIYIVKATESDHGTATGWDKEYGDGEALFNNATGSTITITTDYYTIDGKKRKLWNDGYGIRLTNTTPTTTTIVKSINARGVDNISIYYVDMGHRGDDIPSVGDDGYYGVGCNNIVISHCYIHDISKNGVVWSGDNLLIEYSLMKSVRGAGSTHAQGLQVFGSTANMTVRNNIFENVSGTAVIAVAWGMDGMYVYGNVFHTSDISYVTSPATIVDISDSDEVGVTNALIFNNTFYGYQNSSGHAGVSFYTTSDASTNLIVNNLFVDCDDIALEGDTASHGSNHFISSVFAYGSAASPTDSVYTGSNLFANSADFSFSLQPEVRPLKSGILLESPFDSLEGYNVDAFGYERCSLSNCDVGAYTAAPFGF